MSSPRAYHALSMTTWQIAALLEAAALGLEEIERSARWTGGPGSGRKRALRNAMAELSAAIGQPLNQEP